MANHPTDSDKLWEFFSQWRTYHFDSIINAALLPWRFPAYIAQWQRKWGMPFCSLTNAKKVWLLVVSTNCCAETKNCSFPARRKFLKGIQFSKKHLQFSKIGFRAFLNCMSRPAVQLRNVQNIFKLHEWSQLQCVNMHHIGRLDNIDDNSVVHRLEKTQNSNTGWPDNWGVRRNSDKTSKIIQWKQK